MARSIETLKTLWVRTIREGDFSIEVVDVVESGEHALATVRTILWDGESVQDVREQEARLGALDDFDDDARNSAMVEAWERVLRQTLRALSSGEFDALMPADFVFADLPHLVTCQTSAQFDTALRAKKRFGGLAKPKA